MLEQQRLEYLQAMGIQLWMPREPVAQAAESLWYASQVNPDQLSGINSGNEGVVVHAGSASKLLPDSLSVDSPPLESGSPAVNTSVVAASNSTVPVQPVSNLNDSVLNDSVLNDSDISSVPTDVLLNDSTPPVFELYFALWPCGTLWVSSIPFTNIDHQYQSAVSFALLHSSVLQPSLSHFKWPYIEGSNEDQSIHIALRALTAQWEFLQSQGIKNWISTDAASLEWMSKVAGNPLLSVSHKDYLVSLEGKKELFSIIESLEPVTSLESATSTGAVIDSPAKVS